MGATIFQNIETGKTAQEAFDKAVEEAHWMHGHGGYSGTIAEKHGFTEFPRPKGMKRETVLKMVRQLVDVKFTCDCHPEEQMACFDKGKPNVAPLQALYPKCNILKMYNVYDDKWGPSLCMTLPNNEYLFAGWASC